ncbi:MAG: hypothetical protein EBT36_02550 [Betaproteobacteria bacterium]|jgi:hypothetical protein|nr:hypothetical protein [Pseudomonadota bacterium]NBO04327.1 hypothetical protein [Betaproteobacteria bacterium]NBO94562.1 hypothetical protein [Betaproteobacteria bacterium]NBP36949.1 hypothetical protein [Betaproteobacteria bacterium]NBQ77404.1 hypothetical protein [Betaproteobacteria bacterium]
MKFLSFNQSIFCLGLGLALVPRVVFAAEVAFNPLEWAGGILVIGLVVVSVGFIAEASGEAIDAGLKVVGYQKKPSPEDVMKREEALRKEGAKAEAAKHSSGAPPAVATTSALEQLQIAQAAQAQNGELEAIDDKA